MALISLLRPKWKSGNVTTRLAAVKALPPTDLDTLTTILQEETDPGVSLAALAKITAIEELENLASFELAPATRMAVRGKINRLLGDSMLDAPDSPTLEETLLRIDDPDVLMDIASNAGDPAVRLKAIYRIDDQEMLCAVLESNCGKLPAQTALNNISDETLLERASHKASSRTIRRLAGEKLAALVASKNPPTEEEIHRQELAQYLQEAEELLSSFETEEAADRLGELEEAWRHIDSNGTHPLRPAFAAAHDRFQEQRQRFLVQQQTESDQAETYARQIAADEAVCETIEALIGAPAPDARQQFEAAIAQWHPAPAEPCDPILIDLAARFAAACRNFESAADDIARERKALAILEETCQTVATLLDTNELKAAGETLQGAEKQLTAMPLQVLDPATAKKKLQELRDRWALLREETTANQRRVMMENIEARQAICHKIEALGEAADRAAAEKEFKTLRADWEALPPLPADQREELSSRFQAAVDAFRDVQEQFHHDKDWQQWANQTRKEELCARAESLDQEDNLEKVATTIKDIQAQWKKIGPVPKKGAASLWERFRGACDRNFIRCTPYFEEQDRLRAESLERKEAICEHAESLTASEEWRKTADSLKAMQAEWKGLPFTTRKNEEPLYARFRAACDTFFGRRQVYYQELEQQRLVHYEEKLPICEAAEALAADPVWQNGKKLRDLQTRWKQIGPAPRDREQEIWQRFRAACDTFFAWADSQRQANLDLKEQLCLEAETLTAAVSDEENNNEVAAQLRTLQQKWKEIGPVPNNVREELWKRFRGPCDVFFLAREQQNAQQDEQRQENQRQKEALLLQAEELAQTDNGKDIAEKLQGLQRQWREIGPAPRQEEKSLFRHFQNLCNDFFEDRRQHFAQTKAERLENLKGKEAICLQLENIVGVTAHHEETASEDQALSLAERFRLAREANFILAGKRDDRGRQKEEVRRLREEWKKIGPVPHDRDKAIWKRFNGALDAFYQTGDGRQNRKPAPAPSTHS